MLNVLIILINDMFFMFLYYLEENLFNKKWIYLDVVDLICSI